MTTAVQNESMMRVKLSRAPAQELFTQLERLRSHSGCHQLDEVLQRLSDSLWVSQWLREDVSLEVRSGELVEISTVLLRILDASENSEDVHTLEELSRKLAGLSDRQRTIG